MQLLHFNYNLSIIRIRLKIQVCQISEDEFF